ncbi:MAG: YihY/virulence factor BrkB family protein [Nocardioides sp.]|uniref:YihY/virulence factor BrkB family protein n=1 Tax=Nocardioides sp. TaxID=35761 RepID=UPI0039E66AA6
MPAVATLRARLGEARADHPALDRVIRMQEHYGSVGASQQAGAVTYFGFLSVFPILALALFVVGLISRIYPDADQDLTSAINSVMPGLIGNGDGQLSLDSVERFSGWAAVGGVLGVLYAGLGWLSSLRQALVVTFEVPAKEQPNFVIGKLRDLVTLVVLGIVLLMAVAVTGFVRGFATDLLDWMGLSEGLSWLVVVVSLAVGLGANVVLFFAMFRLLADPPTPPGSLWAGAVLGAVGFEILKQISGLVLSSAKGQPAFQAFGIALVLLVWINYSSRLVMYAAAFAHVSPAARAMRPDDAAPPVQGPQTPPLATLDGDRVGIATAARRPVPLAGFLAGAGTTVAALAAMRRLGNRSKRGRS